MQCPKCGSKNVRVGVSVFMYIDPEDAHRLSKKTIRKKSTELWEARWDKAQIVCRDCNYVHTGC
jgi:hypothetical protein